MGILTVKLADNEFAYVKVFNNGNCEIMAGSEMHTAKRRGKNGYDSVMHEYNRAMELRNYLKNFGMYTKCFTKTVEVNMRNYNASEVLFALIDGVTGKLSDRMCETDVKMYKRWSKLVKELHR